MNQFLIIIQHTHSKSLKNHQSHHNHHLLAIIILPHIGENGSNKNLLDKKDELSTINDVELEELKSSTFYEDALSILKIEKDPEKRELVIYNLKIIKRMYQKSDICMCYLCCIRDDKLGVLRHRCKDWQIIKEALWWAKNLLFNIF